MGHCVIHLSPQRVSAGCRVRPPACLPSPESCGFVICLLFIYFFTYFYLCCSSFSFYHCYFFFHYNVFFSSFQIPFSPFPPPPLPLLSPAAYPFQTFAESLKFSFLQFQPWRPRSVLGFIRQMAPSFSRPLRRASNTEPNENVSSLMQDLTGGRGGFTQFQFTSIRPPITMMIDKRRL